MPFRFKRKESLRDGTLRIVRKQARLAAEHLSAPTDRELHIHEARRALKRLRGLLRLVRRSLPGAVRRRANRLCRAAADAVAPARDAAVVLQTFDGVVRELLPLEAGALAAVRQLLAERIKPAESPADVSRFVPLLLGLPDLLEAAPWRSGGWITLESGLRRSLSRGAAAMRLAYARPSDACHHHWRKRVKDRWHQTRLLHNCWKPVMAALAQELDRLGEILGEDHDLAVLRGLLKGPLGERLSPGLRAALTQRIGAKQDELRRAARRLGQRLYADSPRRAVRRMKAYWKAWKKGHGPRRPCGLS